MMGILGVLEIIGVIGIDDLIIGGLVIGIAALVSSCSGGNEEMEPLPSYEPDAGNQLDAYIPPDGGDTPVSDGGGEIDGGIDQDAGGTTDASDGGTVPQDDGGVPADAGSPDAGDLDGGVEAVDGGPVDGGVDDGPADGGTTDVIPPLTMGMYQCRIDASDIYGMQYSMYVGTEVPVMPTLGTQGFGGLLRFAAAPGTPAGLVAERIYNPAENWPQAGQWIPGFAGDLVAYYWANASIVNNAGELILSGYDTLGAVQAKAILPMTFADPVTGNPTPIAFDTSNEIYLAVDAPVTFHVGCTAGMPDPCVVVEGNVQEGDPEWQPIANQPDIDRLEIRCEKLEIQ